MHISKKSSTFAPKFVFMRDFTLDTYRALLECLQRHGYILIGFADYLKRKKQEGWSDERLVVLRHDVDARPENSLKTAQVEHSLGIKATYYFRAPKGSSNGEGDIIRAIVRLGHEIGYHYEDLSLCNGDIFALFPSILCRRDHLCARFAQKQI